MPNVKTNKKRVVVKLQNMPEELQEEVRKQYPYGFTDHMMRIDKGPGDFFYAVVFETEDTNYLVKIDVNVDGQIEDDDDKEYYNDEIKGADELADRPDAESDEEDELRVRSFAEGRPRNLLTDKPTNKRTRLWQRITNITTTGR